MVKPIIVFVPGSFSRLDFFDTIVNELGKYGGRRAVAIQSVVFKFVELGNTVMVVTHSYGGIPGTESIKGLAKTSRTSKNLTGGISRIVYVTSLVVPVGQSLKDGMGGSAPDWIKVDRGYMHHDIVVGGKMTFSDLSEAEGVEWAKRMPEHSTISFDSPLTYAGYRDVDISYVVCDEDVVIPPQAQHEMIEFLERDTGKTADVHHIKTGHAPQASQPGLVVKAIRKIAERAA